MGVTVTSEPWQQLIQRMASLEALSAAAAYAEGWRCLTVIHGDPETAEEMEAITGLGRQLARVPEQLGGQATQLRRTCGTNDTTTWWWSSSAVLPADTIVQAGVLLAQEYAMAWWRISTDPQRRS